MRGAVVLLILSVGLIAQGESPDAQARALYQSGHTLFEAGRYREAIQKFEAGYALAPRPVFLLNIAQSYRQLFEPARARSNYVAFLAQARPDDPARPEVEELVKDIDRVFAAQAAATPPPAVVVVEAPPPPRRPFLRRHWWIFPVSAVVLAGVGVGIYFGVRPTAHVSCSDATIGCVGAMP